MTIQGHLLCQIGPVIFGSAEMIHLEFSSSELFEQCFFSNQITRQTNQLPMSLVFAERNPVVTSKTKSKIVTR